MDTLAQILFGSDIKDTKHYKRLYPSRQEKVVSRFAPSPTGFLHIGGLFAALTAKRFAESSNGIFYLRIEDTDKKREIDGGIQLIENGLMDFGVTFSEGPGKLGGDYQPYIQSQRVKIYHAFAKELVLRGLAYPCFCTQEHLDAIRKKQGEDNNATGYYGEYATCRNLPIQQVIENINSKVPYVIRLKSSGDINRRVSFKDEIKGTIEMPENNQDIVLLKTDGIPTYHFAHAVDDHLMGTTHVIRGDEWISSANIHLELFEKINAKPPQYAHIAPIMKEEDGGKRKLSKRKDPEADISYYTAQGYPKEAVIEYLLTLANSDYESWREKNPHLPNTSFPFKLSKMSKSGALFDINKLDDISKNVISTFSAQEVLDRVLTWAIKFDSALFEKINEDKQKALDIFSIERGTPKPRKDIVKWSCVSEYLDYFYRRPQTTFAENIDWRAILDSYKTVYNHEDESSQWFARLKEMAQSMGYAPSAKIYKKQPEDFKGHVGDVAQAIRMAITGRTQSPDLYQIMKVLGYQEVISRLER